MSIEKQKNHSECKDVAIVGMGCIFPKAPDLNSYWQNIVGKVDAISDPPPDRLIDDVFDPEVNVNDRIYCRRGGYIDDLATFSPLKYGIMPISVEGAEPEHFMALKVADAALTDAGFPDLPFNRDRFDIILGRGTFVNSGYVNLLQHGFIIDQTIDLLKDLQPQLSKDDLAHLKQSLKSSLPPFNSETASGLASSVMTGIIANRMNLGGKNFTVDAACASALIALETGILNLVTGRCDSALIGAVQISTPPVIHMLFTQLNALSRHPQLRPFDAEADGTMLGEGIGMMVIKRLDDAIRDGHRIYAVVKGVGSSSDGRAKGLLAPSSQGQELAMHRAYSYASVDPGSVGLVETHGTGIPLGDATEISSMTEVFGTRQAEAQQCAIGSVKSMIGHLIPAAGIAGLIKTTLAIYHRTLPPTLHCDEPNSQLALDKTPFYINTEPRPWIHGAGGKPRRAGVNAFGFGGINTHAVLEEFESNTATSFNLKRQRESELFLITAEDKGQLVARCQNLHSYVRNNPQVELVDLAYTLWRQQEGSVRLTLVSGDAESLLRKFESAIKRLQEPERTQIKDRSGMFYYEHPLAAEGKVAFMFPGEGSQYVNMLRDLCLDFPEVRSCFDVLDQAFENHPRGFVPSDFIFPKKNSDKDAAEDRIWDMDGAVDSVITADRAMFRLLHSLGIDPDVIVGHSSGEIMALEAAGAVAINDDDTLIHYISAGNKMIHGLHEADNIPEAQLMAVGGVDQDVIDSVVAASDSLCVAMENCPHQFVLCGSSEVTQQAARELTGLGAVCLPLPFNRAYHTTQFEPALAPLESFFDSLPIEPPRVPMYSCLSAERVPDDIAEIRRLAVLQWARPVRFRETIENMYREGVRIFIEIGPSSNLTGFVNDILNGKKVIAVATNKQRGSGITQLHQTIGHLFASGVEMQLDPLYEPRRASVLDLNSTQENSASAAKEMVLRLGLPRLTLGQDRAEIVRRFETGNGGIPRGEAHNPPKTSEIVPLVEPTINDLPTQVCVSDVANEASTLNAAAQANAGGDDLTMNEYLDTMDTFLKVQQQTMRAYLNSYAGQDVDLVKEISDTSTPVTNEIRESEPVRLHAGRLPLVGEVQQVIPGKEVLARRRLSLEQDRFLQQHTLGGNISKYDKRLVALPVLPLSMALEQMAEVASVLLPGKSLTGIQSVRMYSWIILKGLNLDIETRASLEADSVVVRLQVIDPGQDPVKQLAVEGRFLFSDNYPEATVATPCQLGKALTVSITPEKIYPQALFHGPAFRALNAIDRVGNEGSETSLKVPQKQALFSGINQPELLSEPVLVDAVGQTVGLWIASNFDSNIVAFPIAIDAINLYAPPVAEAAQLICRTRSHSEGDEQLQINTDAEILDAAGRVHIRVSGMRHRRVKIPRLFHEFRGSRGVQLTRPWKDINQRISNGSDVYCCRTDNIPAEFWATEDGIWRTVLAYMILNRDERLAWSQLAGPDKRKTEWLLGRLAAKEAVCRLLRDQQGIEIWPADVVVSADKYGKPIVSGEWLDSAQRAPDMTIAHTRGMAAALAAVGDKIGVGIDIECRRAVSQDLADAILQSEEHDLVAGVGSENLDAWRLRIWCAKEALGKALGRGLQGVPGNLVARQLDTQSGAVHLELMGRYADEFPNLKCMTHPVYTFQDQDLVAACADCKLQAPD
ncbi:MAG: acyltransferase domain-containing protein [Gammaproteobacteria bacterium]|nr:acyltransferase domain-containing protein [Gammaproteobacteria bacterium]